MKTKDAIAYFGTSYALARALGVQPPIVYRWGEEPPPLRQFQLAYATDNFLEVNPKHFPPRATLDVGEMVQREAARIVPEGTPSIYDRKPKRKGKKLRNINPAVTADHGPTTAPQPSKGILRKVAHPVSLLEISASKL